MIPLVFIDEERDVREIAVQIAHIRSPKADGPRHDPCYPRDKLNSDVNLLLLCGVHHHPVDRNGSKYTTEELLAWKKAQIAEGGGFTVHDDEISGLAARLESLLSELVQATRLQLQARFTGGRLVPLNPPQVICLPLEMLNDPRHETAAAFVPGRLIGVEVENHGPVGAEVRTAGIDVDYGSQRGPWQYSFFPNNYTEWRFPCRVDGHSTRAWFDNERQIRRSVNKRFTAYSAIPRRFRAGRRSGTAICSSETGSRAPTCRSGNPASASPSFGSSSANPPEQRSPKRRAMRPPMTAPSTASTRSSSPPSGRSTA
jgi:hypothetical protein